MEIPSQITKNLSILANHISTVLKQLKEHELVECINLEVRKGRSYGLTNIVGMKLVKKYRINIYFTI